MSLTYAATAIQEIHEQFFDDCGIRLLIKREDQNHSLISGNKWWKLKHNLVAAAHELGLKSIGIVRGEEVLPLNNTLKFATEKGMMLHYISRDAYRSKSRL